MIKDRYTNEDCSFYLASNKCVLLPEKEDCINCIENKTTTGFAEKLLDSIVRKSCLIK